MGRSHGCSHPIIAAITGRIDRLGKRTPDYVIFAGFSGGATTRSGNVHPVSIIRVVCFGTVIAKGSYRNDIGIIRTNIIVRNVLVAARKENKTSLHGSICPLIALRITAGIGYEILDGSSHRRVVIPGFVFGQFGGRDILTFVFSQAIIGTVSPAVLGDDSAFVGAFLDSPVCLSVVCLLVSGKDGMGHDAHAGNALQSISAGNAAHAFPVIVHGSNGSRHMGSVAGIRIADGQTVAFAGIVIARMALGVLPQVGRQVFMAGIHRLIYHAHNHIPVTGGVVTPHALDIDIAPGGTVVLQMPLPGEVGVIESPFPDGAGRSDTHDARDIRKGDGRLGSGRSFLKDRRIEPMQPHLAAAGFVFSGVREDALQMVDAQLFQHGIQGGRFGHCAAGGKILFNEADEVVVKLNVDGCRNRQNRLRRFRSLLNCGFFHGTGHSHKGRSHVLSEVSCNHNELRRPVQFQCA